MDQPVNLTAKPVSILCHSCLAGRPPPALGEKSGTKELKEHHPGRPEALLASGGLSGRVTRSRQKLLLCGNRNGRSFVSPQRPRQSSRLPARQRLPHFQKELG